MALSASVRKDEARVQFERGKWQLQDHKAKEYDRSTRAQRSEAKQMVISISDRGHLSLKRGLCSSTIAAVAGEKDMRSQWLRH